MEKSLQDATNIMQNYMPNYMSGKISEVNKLCGDGSDREFYRIKKEQDKSYIVMQLKGKDKDSLKRNSYDWIDIAFNLEEASIKVPKIFFVLRDKGAIIIEDLGDLTLQNYFENNSKSAVINYYQKCVDILVKMSKIPINSKHVWAQRSFSKNFYLKELLFFKSNYIEKKKSSIHFDDDCFLKESVELSSYLEKLQLFFVHRDFHSRNIMLHNNDLSIIDFQDARLGPVVYDAISLIFDPYVDILFNQRVAILKTYMEKIKKLHNQNTYIEAAESWKAVLLQRSLKIIGSYAYLSQVQKNDYLQYIAPTLFNLLEAEVYSDRWPFLSKDLIERLIKHEKISNTL